MLFVGAGEMIELCATHFAAKNPKAIAIANRTLERGEKLATRFGGEVMRLADLPERLHEFDAVISCTASSLPIIGLGAVERALKKRRHRPIFMVDLAVPRDIEPEVQALDDVYLYTVDDLASRGANRAGQPPGRRGAGRSHHRRGRAKLHALDGAAQPRHRAGGVVPLIQQLNAQSRRMARCRNRARQEAAGQGRRRGRGARSPVAWPHAKNAARHPGRAARGRRRNARPDSAQPSRACSCARKAKTASSGACPLTRRSDFKPNRPLALDYTSANSYQIRSTFSFQTP